MDSVGKPIDLEKILVLDFKNATTALVDSGVKFGLDEMRTTNSKNILSWLESKGFKYKQPYSEVRFPCNIKKYHNITINMDPSKLDYSNTLKFQADMLLDIIDKFSNKIKFIALVYERGRGKLHWHMVINIVNSTEFKEALQEKFGKGKRAVIVKKVQPNLNEELEENLYRILNYFKKEDRNKNELFLSK
jgi:hypothetical protein